MLNHSTVLTRQSGCRAVEVNDASDESVERPGLGGRDGRRGRIGGPVQNWVCTYPAQIAEVRRIAPRLPILVAGVGRQGGPVGEVVRAGLADGGGLIISSSRAIAEAEPGPGFARAARAATTALVDEIRAASTTLAA